MSNNTLTAGAPLLTDLLAAYCRQGGPEQKASYIIGMTMAAYLSSGGTFEGWDTAILAPSCEEIKLDFTRYDAAKSGDPQAISEWANLTDLTTGQIAAFITQSADLTAFHQLVMDNGGVEASPFFTDDPLYREIKEALVGTNVSAT